MNALIPKYALIACAFSIFTDPSTAALRTSDASSYVANTRPKSKGTISTAPQTSSCYRSTSQPSAKSAGTQAAAIEADDAKAVVCGDQVSKEKGYCGTEPKCPDNILICIAKAPETPSSCPEGCVVGKLENVDDSCAGKNQGDECFRTSTRHCTNCPAK